MSEKDPNCHWCAGYPNNLTRRHIIWNGGKMFLAREYLLHMQSNCSVARKQRENEENAIPILETNPRLAHLLLQRTTRLFQKQTTPKHTRRLTWKKK